MFILYFFFPAVVLAYLFRGQLSHERGYLYLSAMAYKIVAAMAMTYLQINNYEFGDLYTYFGVARDIAESNLSTALSFAEFKRSQSVAFFNAAIFTVFPPSIYGLAVLSGCSSFLYCLLLVGTAERHYEISKSTKLMIFFLPALSVQSGYIGKETYILPLIGLIFYWFATDALSRYLKIGLALALIAVIRPYQATFLLAALVLAWSLEKDRVMRIPIGVALFGGIAANSQNQLAEMMDNLSIEGGFGELLDVVYSGGSLVLEPYPFPLSLLQSFRPFPWEVNSTFALLAAVECSIVLAYIAYRLFQRLRAPWHNWTQKQKRLTWFMFFYSSIFVIVFSFNANMGDLSRRHIYYYPFLLLLLCPPRRLAASELDRRNVLSRPRYELGQHS